jgi:uncharacterized damage-inducible protein DinB
MNAREMLVQQYGVIYFMVSRNIEGLTHTDSLAAPAAGGGNTANWILGHLVSVHNAIMGLAGAPPVWESEQLERARFDHPIRTAGEAIEWETLVERFNASQEVFMNALTSLSDDALAEPMTDPFGNETSRAGMLSFLALHQGYHAGQLGMARRAAGLKTAILGPEQAAPL